MIEAENDLRERLQAFNLSHVAREMNIHYMRLYRFARQGKPLSPEHQASLSNYIDALHTKTGRGRKAKNYLRRALVSINQTEQDQND